MNPSDLPHKEEVAGSNPASPTSKLPGNGCILREPRAGQGALPGPIAATVLQPERDCPYESAASIALAAESCMSGSTCAYVFRVMVMEACPRSSETTFTLT